MKKLSIFIFCLLAACSAHALEPLTTDHPAHPGAPAARQQEASTTLAYSSSDVPSPRPTAGAAVAQQSNHEAHHDSQPTGAQTVTGEGKIVAVVVNSSQIVIEHGPIKEFMDAMTMGYQVDPPSLLQGLSPSDRVRFTIDTKKKTIVKIEKVQS